MKKCGVKEILMTKCGVKTNEKMWRKRNPNEKCGVKEILMKNVA